MNNWLLALAHAFVPQPHDVNARSIEPFASFESQLAAIRRAQENARPWRAASVAEALGVPAILSAVSLISGTVGTLSLEAWRRGVRLDDPDQIPRIIQRPNPFTTAREFFRDTAYYIATRGESWWWTAARDPDGVALSLYPVPPWEIQVEANEFNRLRPKITWGNRVMRNEDMRHITYLPGVNGRGVGPLQMAGVAVSVTVEAENWAANFFSGSIPSMVGTTDLDLTPDELGDLDKQWVEKASNLPRWLTLGMKMSESPFNAEKAQLTETREHNVGNAARMFNMPGALIEFQMGGSSLTYQNQENIWSDFQRRCLSPHYLEPIEQEMSDLLTRSTVSRFNLDQLLRADPKTRAEFYEKVVPLGYPQEEMLRREGIVPGAVDFAPVPLGTPAQIPTQLPYQDQLRTRAELREVRCPSGHLVGKVAGPAEIVCKSCHKLAVAS